MISTKPSIGGDPEFFIYEMVGDKYIVIPADKILPSKEKKQKGMYGSIFFDGVQAEINPFQNQCRETFIRNIQRNLSDIYNLAIDKYKKKDIVLAPMASIDVDLDKMIGCDRECFRFGCSPDACIYDMKKIKYPNGKEFNTRFSGGHIHLGFDDLKHMKFAKDIDNMERLIKLLDVIPGIMSVCFSHGKEEILRRKWYGQAGTYRIQPHGLEYRTPSSFWLVSPAMASIYLSFIRDCFSISYNGESKKILNKVDMEHIRKVINTVDYSEAKYIYKKIIKPYYVENSNGCDGVPMQFKYIRKFVDTLVNNGYQHVFNPYHMLNYWNVKEPMLEDNFNSIYGIRYFVSNIRNKRFTIEGVRNLGDKKCVE